MKSASNKKIFFQVPSLQFFIKRRQRKAATTTFQSKSLMHDIKVIVDGCSSSFSMAPEVWDRVYHTSTADLFRLLKAEL